MQTQTIHAANQPDTTNLPAYQHRHAILWLLLVGIGFIFYSLPWLVNPGAALTLNGFDLAEWTSLHPPVSDHPAPLVIALLLRLPLSLLTWLVALNAPKGDRSWWLFALTAGFLTFMNAPPLVFVTGELGNANYQQQAMLTGVALLGALLGLSGLLKRWKWFVVLVLGLVGAAAAAFGLMQAHRLFIGFSLPVKVGLGMPGVITTFTVASLVALRQAVKTNKPVH